MATPTSTRFVLVPLALLSGCASLDVYRRDTSFVDSKTTICVQSTRVVEASVRQALGTAVASTCLPGNGPVAAGPELRQKAANGDDLLCQPIRCQPTLLTGQRTPAEK